MYKKIIICLAALFLSACSQPANQVANQNISKAFNPESPINVVATTGMVADAVKIIGGHFVEVTGLMGPGVDPHLYKASAGDIKRLSTADIIFYNGLNLEGKMGDIFVKMARKLPVVAVTETINEKWLLSPPEFAGHYDPHLWFDVKLWGNILESVAAGLSELDPTHTKLYHQNALAYEKKLKELDEWCRTQLNTIPKNERVLITAHDAFGYFGRAYNVEVVALQGISTVSEFGLKDVERIVDLLVKRKIKAVFIESSIPKRSIEAVVAGAKARGHNVLIGGTLFSDAMGAASTPEGNYVGMVKANVHTIVNSLSGRLAVK